MSDAPSDDPIEDGSSPPPGTTRAYSQLLRQQERARKLLQRILDELGAPVTSALLGQLHSAPGERVGRRIEEVSARLEKAMRMVEDCESEIHRSLVEARGEPDSMGPANQPAALTRLLAERKDSPGFSYDLRQDPVRGWIIRWKDYDHDGTVCGGGQFYEKPYAWMEG